MKIKIWLAKEARKEQRMGRGSKAVQTMNRDGYRSGRAQELKEAHERSKPDLRPHPAPCQCRGCQLHDFFAAVDENARNART